jgi:hypothetical protein
MSDGKKAFQMRVTPKWLADLDKWRAKQIPIPSRAEAIRRLVSSELAGISKRAPNRS